MKDQLKHLQNFVNKDINQEWILKNEQEVDYMYKRILGYSSLTYKLKEKNDLFLKKNLKD